MLTRVSFVGHFNGFLSCKPRTRPGRGRDSTTASDGSVEVHFDTMNRMYERGDFFLGVSEIYGLAPLYLGCSSSPPRSLLRSDPETGTMPVYYFWKLPGRSESNLGIRINST